MSVYILKKQTTNKLDLYYLKPLEGKYGLWSLLMEETLDCRKFFVCSFVSTIHKVLSSHPQ